MTMTYTHNHSYLTDLTTEALRGEYDTAFRNIFNMKGDGGIAQLRRHESAFKALAGKVAPVTYVAIALDVCDLITDAIFADA